MKVDFQNSDYVYIQNLNGGTGKIGATMHMGNGLKAIKSVVPVGASIGTHSHNTSIDFNFVLAGSGVAICDGVKETLNKGDIHYCPLGSSHSIENIGEEDLILITFVPEINNVN